MNNGRLSTVHHHYAIAHDSLSFGGDSSHCYSSLRFSSPSYCYGKERHALSLVDNLLSFIVASTRIHPYIWFLLIDYFKSNKIKNIFLRIFSLKPNAGRLTCRIL